MTQFSMQLNPGRVDFSLSMDLGAQESLSHGTHLLFYQGRRSHCHLCGFIWHYCFNSHWWKDLSYHVQDSTSDP